MQDQYTTMLTKKELKAISVDQVYSDIHAPFEVMAACNITGKKSTYLIRVQGVVPRFNDLEIVCLQNATYYRPLSMLKQTAKRYKSTPQMTKAITLCLASCGQNVIGFYLPTN